MNILKASADHSWKMALTALALLKVTLNLYSPILLIVSLYGFATGNWSWVEVVSTITALWCIHDNAKSAEIVTENGTKTLKLNM
jgi:hypothetical protein